MTKPNENMDQICILTLELMNDIYLNT